jgi:hypothetical protein
MSITIRVFPADAITFAPGQREVFILIAPLTDASDAEGYRDGLADAGPPVPAIPLVLQPPRPSPF